MSNPEINVDSNKAQKPRTPGSVKKKRVTVIICSIAVLILAAMIVIFVIYREKMAEKLAAEREMAEINAVLNVDTIYSNVNVNNINIGGLTKEQAKETLTAQASTVLSTRKINYRWDATGYSREFSFAELGVSYDLDAAIEEAYSFGRKNADVKARYAEVMENKERGTYIDAQWQYDESKVAECVKLVAEDIDKEPTNATFSYANGQISVSDSAPGLKMDQQRAIDMTTAPLQIKTEGDIMLLVESVAPEYTKDSFSFTPTVLGTCTSSYGSGNDDRITNLRVAAEKINGQVIYPGKTFSTNAALSPFNEANGYKYAGAYMNGQLVEDIGGGVCQVSSALYNAALEAELEITERYNHSKKVGYMDYGFDATLAGDVKDLKITNNTSYPVVIQARLQNNAVYVEIVGNEEHNPGRTLKFYNKLIDKTDSTITYELYKDVYENGSLVDTVKINKSTYNTK